MRSLQKYYSHKVFSIEDSKDLVQYLVDKIFGTLIAFEMREFDKEVPKKEDSFKANIKIQDEVVDKNDDLDEVQAKFVRRLKALESIKVGYHSSVSIMDE